MRIRLIKKQTIEDYIKKNSASKVPFGIWLNTMQYVDWAFPKDIQQTFGSADLLGNATYRVIFNIGGNNYRMICKYAFGKKVVHLFICWIGTHAQYDKLCKKGQQYTINIY